MLKSPSGLWNSDLIHAHFLPIDAKAILSIPCSLSRVDESLCWHHEKNGEYSVRSGYWVGVEAGLQCSGSGLSSSGGWWKFLWRLKISAKVKLFVWRCCHDWLPSRVNLARKGLSLDVVYPLCAQCVETSMHALWGCPLLKPVRQGCGLVAKLKDGCLLLWDWLK
ncbi:hypothetical protein ACOSQ2_030983 [Xanthoceras sorbifolium]